MPSTTAEVPVEQQDVSALNIDSDTEFQDAPAFLGQQVADEFVPGKWGPQYHVGVKPMEYTIGGKTGAFHSYYRIPTDLRKRSGMFIFIEGHKSVFGAKQPDGQPWPYGKHALETQVCWWVRKDLDFGKGKDGERIVIEGALIPVKAATPEEIAKAGSAFVSTAPAEPEWTEPELEKVLDLIAGLDSTKAFKVVAKAGLSPELTAAILNGSAQKQLEARGMATVSGDGMVTRLAPDGNAVRNAA